MKKSSLFVGIEIAVILGLLIVGGGGFAIWYFFLRVTPETALSKLNDKLETINSAEFLVKRSHFIESKYLEDGTERTYKSELILSQLAKDDYKNKKAYIDLDASLTTNDETETLKGEVYIEDSTFYSKTDDETIFGKNELGDVSQILYENEAGLEKYFQETWLGTFLHAVKDNTDKFTFIQKEDHNGVRTYKYETTDKELIEAVISEKLSEIVSGEDSDVSAKLTLWIGTNGMPVEIYVEVSSEIDFDDGQYSNSKLIFNIVASGINKTNVTIPEGVK
ncbi:hypothetical protein JW962_02440 [Candidatus Dojkabacteria bacterium]|nr:hypothetical protein [Candidatus Dojkabacteria bacterium]